MPNPDLDRKLAEYLDRAPSARADIEHRLDGLKDGLGHLTNEHALLRQSVEAEAKMVQSQLKGISARVDKLEEDVEDTGVHNLEHIKEKAAEATKAKDRLMAYIVAAAGAVALLLLGGAGSVIWYLITKH